MPTRARRGVSEQKAILAAILITLVGGVLFYGGFQNYFAGSGEVALLSAELYKSTDGTCTFSCAVKNAGAKPAKEVTVKLAEEQPAAVPGVSEVSPLEPGQSATLVLSTGSGLVNDYVAGETYIVSVHAVFLDGSAFAKTSSVVCRGGGKPLPQAFEFAVGVEPEGGSAPQGGSVEATVTVSLISGTPSTVSLSVAGLPQGASASFTPSHGTPPFESTMRISVGPLAPVGTYAVEIRARCGAVTETAEFQLTVTEGAFNFAVSVQPSSGATVQGGSVEATVTVSLVSGLPHAVELSAQNLPEGASASFNPQSGNPTFQSALTVSTSKTTPPGTYDILIVGVGGGVERSAMFTLTVAENVAEVFFSAEGVGSDNDGMVLYVDGEVYANLPQAFSWQVGSEHSFEWVSPVGTQTWGKRYVWTSTRGLSTGRSGSIFVPSGGGSIIAAYKTQYYLTMQVDPADGGSVSPESGWFDADGTVEVSAFPAEGYVFSGWMGEGEGSYSGADNPATVTMNGPVRETACFVQMLPWLSGWSLRKSHEIVGSTAGAQTDYQVRITAYYGVGTDTGESVYLNGKCRADFGDVRFTASDGLTLLDYWMESCIASSSAVFWVKVPYIPASPDTATIYVYYGNPSATRADNPQNLDLWQLREHQSDANYIPNILFSKPSASVIRIDSYTAGGGSHGQGYVFITMPKSFLNGKKVQICWNGYFSSSNSRTIGQVLVLDTELNRKQTLSKNRIAQLFTNILLFSYNTVGGRTGWMGWRTDTSGIIDLSAFTSNYVTLVIVGEDGWTGQTVMVDVDWLKILDADNNALSTFDFTESVVMEFTGEYEDYGLYRKYVSPEPSHGAWGSDETPSPSALTLGVSNVGSTCATLHGETARLMATIRGFEWGRLSGVYTDSWTEEGLFPPGTFSHMITNLDQDTIYYFRAKAYSPQTGWLYGDEQSFRTGWLTGWSLRKSHEIVGSTAGAQTDYQVRITAYYGVGTDTGESVYLNGKCRADFGDVRFTASDGTTLLSYWIETYTASSSAVFWVKVPYIPASPDTATIYIYYGNPSAMTTSNGEATFPAFFNGENYISGTIDPDGWTNVYGWGSGGGGTIERGVTMERVYSGIRSYILRINSYNNKYRDGRMNLYKPVTGGDFRFVGKINVDAVSSGQYGATAGFIVAFNIGGTWKAIYYRFAYATSDIKAMYYRGGAWYTPDYQINIANTRDSWLSLDRALASDFQAAGFGDWSQVTDIIVYMAVRAMDGPGVGYDGDVRAFYDNVYVRKYVDPEPSHGAWGSEEILP